MPDESDITEEQFLEALEEEAAWRALGLSLAALADKEDQTITEEQFMAILEEAGFAV